MAIVTSGPYLGFSGTIGNITYYTLPDGRTCAKTKNKKRTTPATPAQAANEQDTQIFVKHMKVFNAFSKIGFRLDANLQKLNTYNAMTRCNRKKVLKGKGADRHVDFSELQISKGSLPLPEKIEIRPVDDGVEFTWSKELINGATRHNDQVVMLAYFPEVREVVAIGAGAQRYTGTDKLVLMGVERGQVAEVYCSFVTDDALNIGNSVYMGQLNW